MNRPNYRLTVQDVLTASTLFATAAGAAKFTHAIGMWEVGAPGPSDNMVALGIAAWFLVLPAALGAAFGCLVSGWRGCWRLALLSMFVWFIGSCLIPGMEH